MKRLVPFGLLALAAVGAICAFSMQSAGLAEEAKSAAGEAALERSRKQVQMLDHVYKQTIVLITDKYVDDVTDFPAGSAAVTLFKNISDAGFHNVRLIDATGQPTVETNVARDAFEKEGVKQLKAGKTYYEQIATVDGQRQLRALTPVPVVLQKCVMCHDHYADVKKGEPIGAISYTVPIE